MYGFRIDHEYGAWGAGFDSLEDAIEAAIENAPQGVAVLVYLTCQQEVCGEFWLA